MSAFKPYPELVIAGIDEETGQISVETASGRHIFKATEYASEEDMKRFVECWNACRKLHSPAAHIEASDEYAKRLEHLRKDAWSRAQELEAQIRAAS